MVASNSAPALSIWDSSRSFPISPDSDGYTFSSKRAYEDHLIEKGFSEVSTDAPKINKPGVIFRKNYG